MGIAYQLLWIIPWLIRRRIPEGYKIVTAYYEYYLSKLPNIYIYGCFGQLNKHEKLVEEIERVLFNT